jgi:hypothetical protein
MVVDVLLMWHVMMIFHCQFINFLVHFRPRILFPKYSVNVLKTTAIQPSMLLRFSGLPTSRFNTLVYHLSTLSLLSTDNAIITSVFFEASQISFLIKVLKNSSTKNMKNISSLTIIHIAFSSVNGGSNLNQVWQRILLFY